MCQDWKSSTHRSAFQHIIFFPQTYNGVSNRVTIAEMEAAYGTPCTARSATRCLFFNSSKPFSRKGTQKFCTVTRFGDRGDRGDRRGTVAVREAYTERQQPGFRAGTSSSIHPLPPLARGPTGKAVLALEVCIRTLHGHAPWTRTGAPRWHRRQT